MKRFFLLALAFALLYLSGVARACSPAAFQVVQQVYGPTCSVQAIGDAEFVQDSYGVTIARLDESYGQVRFTPTSGIYASHGAAFIGGGPYNQDVTVVDARFIERERLRQRILLGTAMIGASVNIVEERRGLLGLGGRTEVVQANAGGLSGANVNIVEQQRGLFGRRGTHVIQANAGGLGGANVNVVQGGRRKLFNGGLLGKRHRGTRVVQATAGGAAVNVVE